MYMQPRKHTQHHTFHMQTQCESFDGCNDAWDNDFRSTIEFPSTRGIRCTHCSHSARDSATR